MFLRSFVAQALIAAEMNPTTRSKLRRYIASIIKISVFFRCLSLLFVLLGFDHLQELQRGLI